MWKTAVGLVACLLPAATAAGAQTLTGRVLDGTTGAPIPEVSLRLISVTGAPIGSRQASDARGAFVFTGIEPGRYRIQGERIGYRETVSGFLAVEAGDSVAFDFRMAQEAVLIEPITVTASARPWYEHLKPPALWEYYERAEHLKSIGRGRFLGPEDLRPLAGMPLSLAVATLPGMQAVLSDDSGARFHLLGRRGCDALFFLNGQQVRLRAPVSRADTADVDFLPGPESLDWFIDDFVSLSDVEAIEVYRGASELPGEFHGFRGNGHCGAVVVWTKRTIERRGGGKQPS